MIVPTAVRHSTGRAINYKWRIHVKLVNTTCAATLLALGLAGAASAATGYAFSPANSPITGSGTATVALNASSITCNVTVTGTTMNPAQVTSVSFSGGPGCTSLMASNLPWKYTPHNAGRATLNHVTINWMGTGKCGANQVKTNVANGTVTIQDHLPSPKGVCSLGATLTMSPPLTIIPAS